MNKYQEEAHHKIFEKFNPDNIKDKYILRESISKKTHEKLWNEYYKNKGETLEGITNSLSQSEIPFLELLSKLILNTFEQDDEESTNINDLQYILTGSPSAGKTTELKRIAHKLINEDKRVIVHFCSLQNTVTNEIKNSSEMWEKIMKSHISTTWANERYTMDEFEYLHEENRLKPIILIDTLDIITLNNNSNYKFSKVWSEFLNEANKKKFRILWTSRKIESKVLRKNIQEKDFPKEIQLPY